MTIRKKQVAFEPMELVCPTEIIVRSELEDAGARKEIVGDVSVPGQNRIGSAENCVYGDKIAEIVISQGGEVGRGKAIVSRANQWLCGDEIIGERLEVAVSKVKFADHLIGILGKTLRAAGSDGYLHRKSIVVVSKGMEGESDLTQVVDALDALRASLGLND